MSIFKNPFQKLDIFAFTQIASANKASLLSWAKSYWI